MRNGIDFKDHGGRLYTGMDQGVVAVDKLVGGHDHWDIRNRGPDDSWTMRVVLCCAVLCERQQ